MWETDTFLFPFQSISSTEVWNSRHGKETRACHNTCHWGWCQRCGNDPDRSCWSRDQWQRGHAGNQLLGLCHCTGQRQKKSKSYVRDPTMLPCSARCLLLALELRESQIISFFKAVSKTDTCDMVLESIVLISVLFIAKLCLPWKLQFPSAGRVMAWLFNNQRKALCDA